MCDIEVRIHKWWLFSYKSVSRLQKYSAMNLYMWLFTGDFSLVASVHVFWVPVNFPYVCSIRVFLKSFRKSTVRNACMVTGVCICEIWSINVTFTYILDNVVFCLPIHPIHLLSNTNYMQILCWVGNGQGPYSRPHHTP